MIWRLNRSPKPTGSLLPVVSRPTVVKIPHGRGPWEENEPPACAVCGDPKVEALSLKKADAQESLALTRAGGWHPRRVTEQGPIKDDGSSQTDPEIVERVVPTEDGSSFLAFRPEEVMSRE